MWLNGYVPLRRGHLPSIRRMLRKSEAELRLGREPVRLPRGHALARRRIEGILPRRVLDRDPRRRPGRADRRRGHHSILAKGKVGIRPRPVTVRVLSPITPEQAEHDDRKLSALVHARMAEELRELRR